MSRIAKTFTFEAAHRLQRHEGQCHNLHGHSYKVEVVLDGPVEQALGSSQGMILDFGRIKEWWKSIEGSLDHTTLLETTDPLVSALTGKTPITTLPFPPTAENLSWYIREDCNNWLSERRGENLIYCAAVRVYETATSWAEA